MIRFAIVEDNPDALAETREYLKLKFPASEIRTATCVSDAKEMFKSCQDQDAAPDVVILDYKLPKEPATLEEEDKELCPLAAGLFPQALILCLTAYPDAASPFWRSVFAGRRARFSGDVLVVVKAAGAMNTLEERIKEYLADRLGQHLLDRVGSFFGATPLGPQEALSRSVARASFRCGTTEINSLIAEIREAWPSLKPGVRDGIKRFLAVTETPDGALQSIGLVREGDPS